MPTGALSVSINPPQQTINSGEKAVTTANVAGGTPPYTCAWYNGTRQSQVVRGGVNWTMRSAGTRDIKVVVTDSAGNSAEAHAQILVQEAGGGQVMPSPPATPEVQPTPTPMPASVDVNGMWRSGNQNFIFYQEGQTIKVIDAYRNGSQLVVWYGEGWIHGNQVHYRLHHSRNTVPDDGDDIHEFTVSADGNTMTGAWNVLAGPPHGGWTLQRVGP
jgi:hypothetical protein